MIKHTKLQLILEKEGSNIFGRVSIGDNLIVDSATSLEALELSLIKTLKEFENLTKVKFDYVYDLTYFFEKYSFINQSKLAEFAKINPSLLRQYSSGKKYPSKEQVAKIEAAITKISDLLSEVQLISRDQVVH